MFKYSKPYNEITSCMKFKQTYLKWAGSKYLFDLYELKITLLQFDCMMLQTQTNAY